MKNILIVDDEQDVLEVMSEMIRSMGHIPHCAGRAEEALEKFNSIRYDLVITDLVMPDLSGIELAKKLRRKRKSTPILITAGVDLKETKVNYARYGIKGFIKKPFKIEEVEYKIKDLLKIKSDVQIAIGAAR